MADKIPAPSDTKIRRWPWIVLALTAFVAVVFALFSSEDTADVSEVTTPAPVPSVTVITREAGSAAARINSFAELHPRWNAEIRATVSGRLTKVHNSALTGSRVSEGDELFEIEQTQYRAAVASAELTLEEARLNQQRAENKVTLARQQFRRDGITPPNDLALHLPELRITERAVASAQAQLESAQQQLAATTAKAPFSGIITRRIASLGQSVSAGEALVHLSENHSYEMTAELSQADWDLLQQPVAGQTVMLRSRDGADAGLATIRQGGGFLDPQTRQVQVFLDVSDPGEGILAGDFLQVIFTGRHIENTVTLPETALTRAGYIWMADADNLLQRITPEILFRTDSTLTIAAPETPGPWSFARTPLASFLPGQRITPLAEE